jgi:ribosomal protein S18
LWVDSAAAVHSNRDRHRQADQRTHERIDFPTALRLLKAYNGYLGKAMPRQVTMGGQTDMA